MSLLAVQKVEFDTLVAVYAGQQSGGHTYTVYNKADKMALFSFTVTNQDYVLNQMNHSGQAKKHVAVFRKKMVDLINEKTNADGYLLNNYKLGMQGTFRAIAALLHDTHLFAAGQAYNKQLAIEKDLTTNYIYFGYFGPTILKGEAGSEGAKSKIQYEIIQGLQDLTGYKAKDLYEKLIKMKPNYSGGFILPVGSPVDLSKMTFETYRDLRG